MLVRSLICLPLAAACLWHLRADPAAAPGPGLLADFLEDPRAIERLQPVIDRLESEAFPEREAASRELEALPALPGFIRELAAAGTLPPESDARLRDLVAKHPVEHENSRLSEQLRQLANLGTKGELASIAEVMRRDLWQPDPRPLHAAAAATVVPADLPWLEKAVRDDSPAIRRLAASALGGLAAEPPAAELLESCLEDADENVVMLAAGALAETGNAKCLAAFARLLASDHFKTRYRSARALRGLTGQEFEYDPSLPPAENTAAIDAWQTWTESEQAAITGPLPTYEPIYLFSGHGLDGWELYANGKVGDIGDIWQIDRTVPHNETLYCSGRQAGDLWTKSRFDDYVLSLDYKLGQAGHDSGVGVLLTKDLEERAAGPGYLEVQLLPGKAGDIYQIGGIEAEADGRPIRFLHPRTKEAHDPVGTWNHLEIQVRSGRIEARVNGRLVNRTSKGPQAPGRIVLRNEGQPVWFRDIMLHPGDGS
jgi:hypothetical protein